MDGDFGTVGAIYCSVGDENIVKLDRKTQQSKFVNVSKQLLSICADTNGDMKCDTRVFLFDDPGDEYWWEYTNTGLKLAQLRFYEIPTNVGLTP